MSDSRYLNLIDNQPSPKLNGSDQDVRLRILELNNPSSSR